jgi:hypothetical protein
MQEIEKYKAIDVGISEEGHHYDKKFVAPQEKHNSSTLNLFRICMAI